MKSKAGIWLVLRDNDQKLFQRANKTFLVASCVSLKAESALSPSASLPPRVKPARG